MLRFLLFIASVCVLFWVASFWAGSDNISDKAMKTSTELATRVTTRVSDAVKETKKRVRTARRQAVDEKNHTSSKEAASRIKEAVEKELNTPVGTTAEKAQSGADAVNIDNNYTATGGVEEASLNTSPGELDAARILSEIDGLLNP